MKIAASWPFDLADVLIVVGYVIVIAGVGMVWTPAAVVLGGIGLILTGVAVAHSRKGHH